MLRLEHQAAVGLAAVHLKAGLVGIDLQQDARGRLVQLQRRLSGRAAQHEIVVEFRGHRLSSAEVEGRAVHRSDLARRDQFRVDRGIVVRVDLQDVRGRGPLPVSVQVEPRVERGIEDGRRVGDGGVLQHQLVLVGQRAEHRDLQVARIAFFTVGRDARHQQRAFRERLKGPVMLVKTALSAVQVVLAFILRELPGKAVEVKTPLGDAVAVAAHDGLAIVRIHAGLRRICAAPHHVLQRAVLRRHFQAQQAGAVRCESRRHAVLVADGERRFLRRLVAAGQQGRQHKSRANYFDYLHRIAIFD